MLKNATYNMMEAATVLSKGLHRYDTFLKDSAACKDCQDVWTRMRQVHEEQLKRVMGHLKEHVAKEI